MAHLVFAQRCSKGSCCVLVTLFINTLLQRGVGGCHCVVTASAVFLAAETAKAVVGPLLRSTPCQGRVLMRAEPQRTEK